MTEKLSIRKAVPADAAPIHELHLRSVRQLCRPAYSPELIEVWLKPRRPEGYLPGIHRGEMYVVEIEGRMVGFGHAVPGEILATFVEPEFAGQGIGKVLLEHGIKLASVGNPSAIRLESTLNARPFYEKFGFEVVKKTVAVRSGVEIPCLQMQYTPGNSKEETP
jgi:putative acetyltransferase